MKIAGNELVGRDLTTAELSFYAVEGRLSEVDTWLVALRHYLLYLYEFKTKQRVGSGRVKSNA